MTQNKLNQTDIFSLFGIEDEYAIEQKRKEEERLKKQEEMALDMKKHIESASNDKSSSGGSKKTTPKFEVNDQTKVYFYTEVIEITDYFSIEELTEGLPKKNKDSGEIEYTKITENHVKNRLKKDYPVLETGAQLVYLDKKNIISIILQAKKKGLDVDCSKGVLFGLFSAPTHKIPFHMLRDFISIAKHFSDEYGTEVHADIYFDIDKKSYFMDIPKQLVHPVWVEITEELVESALKILGKNCIKCMEIHSHHTMKPFPSSQDNESERSILLYAIVGSIDKFFPEITVRTFDIENDTHIPLNPWSVFESPFNELPTQHDLSVVEVAK